MGFGFSKDRKLRKRAEFVRVQGSSSRATTPHFVFLIERRVGADEKEMRDASARIGFVVSKKVGGAVVRNRIKRVAREVFRLHADWFPKGIDLVVIARNGAEQLGLADMTAEWARVKSALAKRAADLWVVPKPREK